LEARCPHRAWPTRASLHQTREAQYLQDPRDVRSQNGFELADIDHTLGFICVEKIARKGDISLHSFHEINSNYSYSDRPFWQNCEKTRRCGLQLGLGGFVIATLVLSTGCQNQVPSIPTGNAEALQQSIGQQKSETLTLREGDVIKISIPGAPNLDTVQTIRRDGKIALALVGEVQAAGLKPAEVQADLLKLYAPQLVSKEVIVSVVSSSFPTFVSGAVLHPGKVVSDRPITALKQLWKQAARIMPKRI